MIPIRTLIIYSGILACSLFSGKNYAQQLLWSDVSPSLLTGETFYGDNLTHYRPFRFDEVLLKNILSVAPAENPFSLRNSAAILSLPMPDGSTHQFRIIESPVMQPGLAKKYPQIKTFAAQGITDKRAYARFDFTPLGFHGMIVCSEGSVFIDPYNSDEKNLYISYFKKDIASPRPFECEVSAPLDEAKDDYLNPSSVSVVGEDMRTYRLALACTGEYAKTKGGTKEKALAAMVTSVNRVTGIYENEVGIRLILIDNTDTLIYTDAGTDPYANNSGGTMLSQNQQNVDKLIGSANYDIGHVFSTGGGGIAGLGVVCRNGSKAQGVTGLDNPTGDAFDVDFVAHEMGHQFGASHTFNSQSGSCGGGNRSGSSAYEPGSGNTIMAYAGICGSDNIAIHSIPYFHTKSFDEIITYSQFGSGSSCPETSPTANTAPTDVLSGEPYIIPKGTPFKLTGSGSDPDGDPITFSWEEFDLGPAGSPNSPKENAPIFRSFAPDTIPSRIFPKLTDILNNKQVKGEILPSYSREVNFRLTARDNRIGGGGVSYSELTTISVDTSGPFLITSQNTKATFAAGSLQTITWSVNNTDKDPVNCSKVNILFSVDGGKTFSYVLASNTDNDGTEEVSFPNEAATKGRIKVESVGNIFFDISNADLTLDGVSGVAAKKEGGSSLNLYPNPATGLLNIVVNDNYTGLVKLSIVDETGRVIREFSGTKNSFSQTFMFDTEELANGIYYVKVVSGSAINHTKLVKL